MLGKSNSIGTGKTFNPAGLDIQWNILSIERQKAPNIVPVDTKDKREKS